jgi:hypothetical protein
MLKTRAATHYAILLMSCLLPEVVAAQHFSRCNEFRGSKFNTEPASGAPEIGFVVPKSNPSVDFIPGGGINGSMGF